MGPTQAIKCEYEPWLQCNAQAMLYHNSTSSAQAPEPSKSNTCLALIVHIIFDHGRGDHTCQ
jgi:hypothetical protein